MSKLIRAAAVAASALALGAAAGVYADDAHAGLCSVVNAVNGGYVDYQRCQIPDLDQVRAADPTNSIPGLPNNGLIADQLELRRGRFGVVRGASARARLSLKRSRQSVMPHHERVVIPRTLIGVSIRYPTPRL